MANVALMLSMLTLLGFATNTQISPGMTLKNPRAGRERCNTMRKRLGETKVRYLTDGTRMPASPPGSWHQAWAPDAQSKCLHFQIYDCMINEDFTLPSATLQSVFPINKEPAMTQEDWFLISIWCHRAESTFLLTTANWHESELGDALINFFLVRSWFDETCTSHSPLIYINFPLLNCSILLVLH